MNAKFEQAREATAELRDATREGRTIHFRKRDPLVLAIHDALDEAEATIARLTQREANYHDIISELNAVSGDLTGDLQKRVDAILIDCDNPQCQVLSNWIAKAQLAEAQAAQLTDARQALAAIVQEWREEAKDPPSAASWVVLEKCADQIDAWIAAQQKEQK